MKCSFVSRLGSVPEQKVTGSVSKELISPRFLFSRVKLSLLLHTHFNTQMHSGVEGEPPDGAQCIAGSPTEWLGALSPICS